MFQVLLFHAARGVDVELVGQDRRQCGLVREGTGLCDQVRRVHEQLAVTQPTSE